MPDILQLLYFQKKTGVLVLTGRMDRVRLLFYEGNIVGAESRKRDAENRLGRVLEKRGVITGADIESVTDAQKEEGGKFGALLVKKGFASKEQIQEVVTFQITETLVELFSWRDGRYDFEPQSIPLDRDVGVVLNTEHFLMEGARLVDEWSQIRDKIDIYSVFVRVPGAKGALTPEERRTYDLVDGKNDVGSIADITGIDSYTVSMHVLALLEKGVVTRKQERAEAAREAKAAAKRAIPGLKAVLAILMLAALVVSLGALVFFTEGDYETFRAWQTLDQVRFEVEAERYRSGSYPSRIDVKDPWGTPYRYERRGDGFTVRSAGPDGTFGTEDDLI
jgi:DNA-binding CsgD family transcriptional regulator